MQLYYAVSSCKPMQPTAKMSRKNHLKSKNSRRKNTHNTVRRRLETGLKFENECESTFGDTITARFRRHHYMLSLFKNWNTSKMRMVSRRPLVSMASRARHLRTRSFSNLNLVSMLPSNNPWHRQKSRNSVSSSGRRAIGMKSAAFLKDGIKLSRPRCPNFVTLMKIDSAVGSPSESRSESKSLESRNKSSKSTSGRFSWASASGNPMYRRRCARRASFSASVHTLLGLCTLGALSTILSKNVLYGED
jgi:hypothetical protein